MTKQEYEKIYEELDAQMLGTGFQRRALNIFKDVAKDFIENPDDTITSSVTLTWGDFVQDFLPTDNKNELFEEISLVYDKAIQDGCRYFNVNVELTGGTDGD